MCRRSLKCHFYHFLYVLCRTKWDWLWTSISSKFFWVSQSINIMSSTRMRWKKLCWLGPGSSTIPLGLDWSCFGVSDLQPNQTIHIFLQGLGNRARRRQRMCRESYTALVLPPSDEISRGHNCCCYVLLFSWDRQMCSRVKKSDILNVPS